MPTPALQTIEHAHDVLGLTSRQVARALRTDEPTLRRWRSGVARPGAVTARRLRALRELEAGLLGAMRPEAARAWLHEPNPALGGRVPADLVCEGDIEPVTRLLAS